MSEENLDFAATDNNPVAGDQDTRATAGGETIVVAAAGDPVPLDTDPGAQGATTPSADFPDTVAPDAQNVVHLPAGVSIDDNRGPQEWIADMCVNRRAALQLRGGGLGICVGNPYRDVSRFESLSGVGRQNFDNPAFQFQ